jgi:hypothetical protein
MTNKTETDLQVKAIMELSIIPLTERKYNTLAVRLLPPSHFPDLNAYGVWLFGTWIPTQVDREALEQLARICENDVRMFFTILVNYFGNSKPQSPKGPP